jgi:hypothetical protein
MKNIEEKENSKIINNLYIKKNKNRNSSVVGKKNVFKKSEPPKKTKVEPKNSNENNKRIKISRFNNKIENNKIFSSGRNLSNSFNKIINLRIDPLKNLHKKKKKKKDVTTDGN